MLAEELLKDVDLRKMLDEEKKARLDNEFIKGAQLCVQILKYFTDRSDLDNLTFLLLSLNKKRSQSRESITTMVKFCLNDYIPKLTQKEQLRLLKTIIEVTEGRIFVEFEYSVAIRKMTEIHLSLNQLEEAAKLIQDVQIETFGSLDRAYKVEYILFQMKILLEKGDFIRTLIVSNKINRRHLNDEGLELLKVEFYELLIRYYIHEEKFLEVSKCYKIIYDFVKDIVALSEKKHEDGDKPLNDNKRALIQSADKKSLFENYVMYLAICPPELEVRNMFNELMLSYKKELEFHPEMMSIVKKRLLDDLIYIDDTFLQPFKNFPIFSVANAKKHFELFRKFWIQHDVSIFQKFFSQIRLSRISSMIGVSVNEIEAEIADMVIGNYIYAKINRINSTVNFKRKQTHHDVLNDLNFDLGKMLDKIETTCHLIHKENLKYEIK